MFLRRPLAVAARRRAAHTPAAAPSPARADAGGDPVVRNAGGVQMLPPWLWRQLFPAAPLRDRCVGRGEERAYPGAAADPGGRGRVEDTAPDVSDRIRAHLRSFDLNKEPVAPLREPAPFALPPLQGTDIASHFRAIALQQCQPYFALAQ